MQLDQLTKLLNEAVPNAFAEDFDNVGLLVGEPSKEISNILVCLDCLAETIDEAISKKCELVVCFHPIIFSGLKKLTGSNYVEKTVIKAIQNNIAIYCIHTNLDNMYGGSNFEIGNKIGLDNLQTLIPTQNLRKLYTYVPAEYLDTVRNELFDVGAGEISDYKNCSFTTPGIGTFLPTENAKPTVGMINQLSTESEIKLEVIFEKHLTSKVLNTLIKFHPYEEVAYEIIDLVNSNKRNGMGVIGELNTKVEVTHFIQNLKKLFNQPVIRHSSLVDKPIKKVALVGGSGGFAISKAIAAGADVFITADLKYHQFFQAEGKINLIELGHYEMEQFNPLLIARILEKISNFAVHLSEVDSNPVNYT